MSFKLRLFQEVEESPVSGSTSGSLWEDTELESVITPYKNGNSLLKESNADFSIEIPPRTRGIRSRRTDVRKSLFCKRPADLDFDVDSPVKKKRRHEEFNLSQNEASETTIDAVERLTTNTDLIADGTRTYCLPTVKGKHSDLKSISVETMSDVLSGNYADRLGQVTIVDCRYPYEYDGGHIDGAVNMYTKDQVHTLLQRSVTSDKPHVLIFHCEFSSERGPKMYRFLRSQDREMNKDSYPKLNFPEIYLLDGGYKAFFTSCEHQCQPISYKPMLHEDHAADLRHFRVKSKSWSAGDKKMSSRRQRSRMNLLSLEF